MDDILGYPGHALNLIEVSDTSLWIVFATAESAVANTIHNVQHLQVSSKNITSLISIPSSTYDFDTTSDTDNTFYDPSA